MRNSLSQQERRPFRGQGMRNRFGRKRNRGLGRNDNPDRSAGQEQRPEGPHRPHRRILRQMHASDRKGKDRHGPHSRRRRRPPMKRADFMPNNRKKGAFVQNRRRGNAVRGRRDNRQDRNFGRRSRWLPLADICVSDDNLIVNVELPGVSQDDITVSVAENRLTIKGKKKPNRSDNLKVRKSRRQFGRFHLTFPLPRNTEASEISADFKDGILTISVPKPETAKPTEIVINAE